MRASLLLLPAALCALAVGGCGNTLQVKPIPHNILEGLVASRFPVYWLGDHFEGMQITETTQDVTEAFAVQYGDCLQGGQGFCTPPLRIITTPDNSFLPGGGSPERHARIRGVGALVGQQGRSITIPTGPVVVDIYARNRAMAMAAARHVVAINLAQSPGQVLPAPLPDTGFAQMPLPAQRPSAVRPLD